MKALIPAAGPGWRPTGGEQQPPKCLRRSAGCTLLERHLDALTGRGIDGVVIGVGYKAERIRDDLQRLQHESPVHTVHHAACGEGNVVTLWALRDWLRQGEPVLVTDADVLCG